MVHRFKAVAVSALIVMWALSSFASFWIIHSSVPTLLGRVAYLRRENRPLDAQHLLEQRLTAEPENQQVRAELANVLVVTKDEERAVKEATLASEADPNDYSRLATLAMALARKDPDRAIELARRAIKIAPGFVLAYQQLAVLLLAKENFAEVEQIARDGLSLEPFHPIFHQALGESLLHRHELAESTSQLKLACALGPQNSWAHCLLAQAYELQHQTSEAISEYATVLQLQPDFPAALNNLAWLRATLSDEQFRDGPEAVRLAERACQITDYKEPMYVGTLAAAYAEAGRLDDAVKAATKARDLARANQQQELVEKNEELMKLFAARKPYRQPEK
jgi:Flp pilus assembly protein TadD